MYLGVSFEKKHPKGAQMQISPGSNTRSAKKLGLMSC